MDDFNNNPDPQDQNQSSNENTYWESQQHLEQQQFNGQSEQITGQSSDNTSQTNRTEAQTTAPQTPEQFYTYYQRQINNVGSQQQENNEDSSSPYYEQPETMQLGYSQYQTGASYQKPKKKFRGRFIAAVVTLALILSGATAAYAFRGTLLNTFAELTKTPAEYYAYVEKESINKSLNTIKPLLDQTQKDTAVDMSSDITLNRESINSLMQSSMGVSLEDFESQLGIPIESFGLDLFYGRKENIINENLGLQFNNVDIITMELFMDTAAKQLFVRLPELSKAYLNFSDELSNSGFDISKYNIPTSDQTIDFMNRYSNVVIDNISRVKIENNYELSLNTITTKCNRLTVTITNEDAYNILKAILTEARDDEYIINLLSIYNMTKEEYQQSVDDAMTELKASSDTLLENDITMLVYVDGRSHIIGREITSEGSKAAFGYTLLNDLTYVEYNMYAKDDAGNKVFDFTGNQEKQDGAYDGTAVIAITDPTQELFSTININLDYEDFRLVQKNKHLYRYGKFTLSSLELMGMQITSEYTVDNDIQKNKLAIQMGATPLATIDTTIAYPDDYQVSLPPKDAQVFNSSQLDSYQATLDIEGYLKTLSTKLGIDLNSLLSNYMGYSY